MNGMAVNLDRARILDSNSRAQYVVGVSSVHDAVHCHGSSRRLAAGHREVLGAIQAHASREIRIVRDDNTRRIIVLDRLKTSTVYCQVGAMVHVDALKCSPVDCACRSWRYVVVYVRRRNRPSTRRTASTKPVAAGSRLDRAGVVAARAGSAGSDDREVLGMNI